MIDGLPPSTDATLAGWGNCPVERCRVYRPEQLREAHAILDLGEERHYIARGLGRSYGDAALNRESGVILAEQFDRMLAFDEQTGALHCEGGVSLADIIATFLPRGWFPSVSPGTKFVTVGGAIAADIHGKNHHRDGSIASFVDELDLLIPNGEILTCSPQSNADVFWATIGGMGLTGLILRARMRLRRVESAYLTVDYECAANLDSALERFTQSDEKYLYSVAWIDGLARGGALGRSVLMRGNHSTAAELPRGGHPLHARTKRRPGVPFFAPSFLLNSLSVRVFNSLYYRTHRDSRRVVTYDNFFYPLDSIGHWNRLYGRRGFVQYQLALPRETGRQGLIEVLEAISKSGRSSFLAVLKTFGEASGGLLSFPIPGWTLALDMPYTGRDLEEFLARLNTIVLSHGGRVYLAKDAFLTAGEFAAMYPQLEKFKAIKRTLDPDQRLSSSLARRIGIVDGA